MLKLLLVDEHLVMRDALMDELDLQPDLYVVGKVNTARGALDNARLFKPDIILLDHHLPDGGGLETARALLGEHPEVQIIILTESGEDDDLLEAARIGVKGFLMKSIAPAKLIAAVRGMLRGEAPLSREMTARLIAQVARGETAHLRDPGHPLHQLTSRELQVLCELSGGLSNHEIAIKLVVSENTVRNHVHKILEKLSLRSRREASALAKSCGLTPSREPRA